MTESAPWVLWDTAVRQLKLRIKSDRLARKATEKLARAAEDAELRAARESR